jgi:hypothetical protein
MAAKSKMAAKIQDPAGSGSFWDSGWRHFW